MTQQDKIKVLKAGFTVIRLHSHINPGGNIHLITKGTPDQYEWHHHGKYPSRAAMEREAAKLLKSDKIIMG
jgi:hypothetical protein